MTAQPNVVNLPPRPSATGTPAPPPTAAQSPPAAPNPGANAQNARTRTRGKIRVPSGAQVSAIMSGASLIDNPPPAIMTVWAAHCAAARFHEGWAWRGPRYAYGAVHAFGIVAVLYFAAWATDSIPKAAFTAGVFWALAWLAPFRVFIEVTPGHFWIQL